MVSDHLHLLELGSSVSGSLLLLGLSLGISHFTDWLSDVGVISVELSSVFSKLLGSNSLLSKLESLKKHVVELLLGWGLEVSISSVSLTLLSSLELLSELLSVGFLGLHKRVSDLRINIDLIIVVSEDRLEEVFLSLVVLDLTRLSVVHHLLDGVLLGLFVLLLLGGGQVASSSGETLIASGSSLTGLLTHGTDTNTRALNIGSSIVLTSWAGKLGESLTSGLSSSFLGLSELVLGGDHSLIDSLTRLVLDLTSTSLTGSLLGSTLLLEESEGVHDLISVHALNRVLRLELGELLLSELFKVSIREFHNLQELSVDEATGLTASAELEENVEV